MSQINRGRFEVNFTKQHETRRKATSHLEMKQKLESQNKLEHCTLFHVGLQRLKEDKLNMCFVFMQDGRFHLK